MNQTLLIVGSGFAGSVCAREMAEAGYSILLIDKRPHIGGNAFDRYDDAGVLIHPYGPHIFHTNSEKVFAWLSQFTEWRPYEHRVLAQVEENLYPIPINRRTINGLYGLDLDEAGVQHYLERVRVPRDTIQSSEDVVLNSVGSDLCEKFFRGYTRKQWGLDLSELSAGVASRIPTRCNDDDRYFTDTFQAMPREGYTAMFERMLDHPNIHVQVGTDYAQIKNAKEFVHTIYTGPIDAFFHYRYGKLPYRSLRFEHQHLAQSEHYQEVGTVNYPNDHAYTRITEFKHLTGQVHTGTSIVREYPQDEGDPYYPVPRPENEALYQKYKSLAEQERNVSFVGRLAQYRYYNMDQVVAAALKSARTLLEEIQRG
ncbi:UDP-galactopyranose mutase [Acidithiobacillus acidisediminis]|uniref:UDP-galactopyranose mutase n=1 Tax=Acidithiobacillus acidisediminis TaxID=2937799 RepID=UPI00200BE755|nr:UDP-galactopyranose mutase [Acidithiobacillus sp. S30A2]